MTRRTAWFLLLSAVLVSCRRPPLPAKDPAPDAPVVVTVSVDPVRATLLDTITVRLRACADRGLAVTLPEYDTEIAGLRIADAGRELQHPPAGRQTLQHWYTLQADQPGTYLIPAQQISWQTDNGTPALLSSPQITLQVLPPADNATSHMTDIHDLKPLLSPPRSLALLITAGVLALLLALAAGLGIRHWLARRHRRPAQPPQPPERVALAQLDQLIRGSLDARAHVFRLSDIFRHYLAARFRIVSVECTTEELLPCLQQISSLDDALQQSIRQLLSTTDLVKFARYRIASEEIEQLHARIRHVIAATTPADTTEKTPDAAL